MKITEAEKDSTKCKLDSKQKIRDVYTHDRELIILHLVNKTYTQI